MVAAAKSAIPTINDQATAMQLTNCTKNMVSALADLRSAAQKVSGTWGEGDTEMGRGIAGGGEIPNINYQAAVMLLTNFTKNMGSALADLRSAAQKVSCTWVGRVARLKGWGISDGGEIPTINNQATAMPMVNCM